MPLETSPVILPGFNAIIEYWAHEATDYSLADLHVQPDKNSWSLGQLMNHIIRDTNFHIDQMKLALTDQQFSARPMHPDGVLMLAKNEFPDTRITGHPDNLLIGQPATNDELAIGFGAIQHEVQQLQATFDFDASAGKSAHPGLGYFTAAEWLQFTEMHMRHHLRQKKRIDQFLSSRYA